MSRIKRTMAQRVALAVGAYQRERTGHAPAAVTVVLGGNTLVVTLHDALSPAEKALSRTPSGAARVQEFHRQLFANSAAGLRQDIRRITGVEVREAAAEVETKTGTVVHVFTSGTMVQVFLLAENIKEDAWAASPSLSGCGSAPGPAVGSAEGRRAATRRRTRKRSPP